MLVYSKTPTPEQEGPSTSNLTFLESVGSKELAYYITQYDYELFNAVNIHEYIFRIFGKESHKQITANLDLLLRRFNEVQLWVETQILLTQHLNKRVYLLKKFIKLAAHCKEYNNWYSFFAVVMALNSVAVSRLSQTWEKLPSKFRKIYEEFEGILEPSRNHRVYRLLAGKMKPPILPFMPLLIKVHGCGVKCVALFLLSNQQKIPHYLRLFRKTSPETQNKRMISSTIRLIQYCRSEPFKAEPPTQVKIAQEITIFVRQLEELCQQSPAGCIMQSEFSEDSTQNGKRKRKKSKKEKKHGSRGRKNKRKMSTSSEINHETDETCSYVDPPTDDEDYEEDDGSECLKTQQIIGD
ncbi:rap guanine nucleotide exchange factor 4 [Pocillopora verrucosa]|uniref:rap guanine nucleotide exchange factor 4 n=1 Tax=Pocillopora verrucosa TaxID=203993 RepID=UPI00333EC55D